MQHRIKVWKEVELKTVVVTFFNECWRGTYINDVPDFKGEYLPFKDNTSWNLRIDIDTGVVKNWPKIKVHVDFPFTGIESYIKDIDGNIIMMYKSENNIPDMFIFEEYFGNVKMTIDKEGKIKNWGICVEDYECVEYIV